MRKKLFHLFTGAALALLLAGCAENPADDVAEANVTETDPKAEEAAAAAETEKPELPPAVQTFVFGEDSKLEFVGSKVTGSHEGGFSNFTGYFNVDVANYKLAPNAYHAVMIDMASVYSDSDRLTGHLKSADFFDVESYPSARFELNKAETTDGETYLLSGTLELHGETKAISFPATVKVAETQDSVSVQSEFSINRMDFGIKYAGKADDLIREEVVIKFDVTAAPGEKRQLELGGSTGTGTPVAERRGPGGGGPGGGGRPDPAQMIANLDTDGDGKLSQEEAPERAWQFLSRADTDGDNLLSLEELQAMPRPERGEGGGRRVFDPARMMERMDENADQKITQDEAPEFLWERLLTVDKDGDSAITLEELKEMTPPEGGPGRFGPGGMGGGNRGPGGGPGGPGMGGGNRGPGGPGGGDAGANAGSDGGGATPSRPPLEEE